MKINLVTCLIQKNILDKLRLWSLCKSLQKRGLETRVFVVKKPVQNETASREAASLLELFPDYKEITSLEQLQKEIEDEDITIVTGERTFKGGNLNLCQKALLLKDIGSKKYAIQVGYSDLEYTYVEKAVAEQYFSFFDGLAVHTKENQEYLKQFYPGEVLLLPDNTLMLRANEYNQITKKYKSKEEYILFDAGEDKDDILKVVHKVREETNLPVICLSNRYALEEGFRYERVVSPQKYLGIVKAAKYVITNRERSALFSTIWTLPFLYVTSQQDSVTDYLDSVKLNGNHIANVSEYTDISMLSLWNGYALHKRLAERKKELYAYIDQMLEVKSEEEYVNAPTDILKKDCCGCYACAEVCPVQAIHMEPDNKGYYFPVVNPDTCISCQLCKKTCVIQEPRVVEHKEAFPRAIAAYHKELDVRTKSSSGAMFPGFARHIIEDCHGYVAGAKYDEDMNVVSSVANTMEGVKAFYGSKYCKSLLDGSYQQIKKLLDAGETVLFSGLPCECSGLRAFLRKDYEKLFICEIICHAGPSAKVFKSYIGYLEKKFGSKVTNVTFRQKKNGWQPHLTSMVVEFKDKPPLRVMNRTNNYYRVFANDIIARESCSACRFTKLNRAGDVTIGDFWGIQEIHPDMFDNQGASFVLINNEQGQKLWDMAKDDFTWVESSVDKVFKKNHSEPISYKIDQREFFQRMENGEPINDLLEDFNDLKK